MNSRAEVTTRYAKAYVKAAKGDKGRILDEVVAVTGWSRDNARRRLSVAAKRPPGGGRQVAVAGRKRRSPKYSYDRQRQRRGEDAAAGVGGFGWAVRKVPRCVDAPSALWAGTPRRAR